jgi:DNA-binding transcriptional LysR family regulator
MLMNVSQIELRQLEALIAVVDEGSFGRAAQRLGFTQSAISQQVAGLERAVGSRVLDRPRGPKRSELTPVGHVVLGHARAVLERLELAAAEVASTLAGTSGRLLIGTFQSASVKLLPDVVGRFKSEVPDVDVRLYESDDNVDLQQRLLIDELDVSFLVGPVTDEGLETIEIVTDEFVVLLPTSEAAEHSGAFPMAGLAGRDMVGQQGGACQDLIEQGMAEHGVIPHYIFQSNDNGAVQNMVKAGMGLAVMPMLAVDSGDAGVRALPLDPPLEPRSILLAVRSERTIAPAVSRFVDLAREWCHSAG